MMIMDRGTATEIQTIGIPSVSAVRPDWRARYPFAKPALQADEAEVDHRQDKGQHRGALDRFCEKRQNMRWLGKDAFHQNCIRLGLERQGRAQQSGPDHCIAGDIFGPDGGEEKT